MEESAPPAGQGHPATVDAAKRLLEGCIDVLQTPQAQHKATKAKAFARETLAAWGADLSGLGRLLGEIEPRPMPGPRPARPDRPVLVAPARVPRRRLSTPQGRAALLHALAHIELNAIDLAFDMIARFAGSPAAISALGAEAQGAFVADWLKVGGDEARHFLALEERLADLGFAYGDFPAHDGLWEAAIQTAEDFPARLAVVPMVLEARGLDVTPGMIDKLTGTGDQQSTAVLKQIYRDEITHVAVGTGWFCLAADRLGKEPEEYFHQLIGRYFKGRIKPPFNEEARRQAGLLPGFYEPLAASSE